MSFLVTCSATIAVLFWQLVNVGILGYSIAFLFWPEDSVKLFYVNATAPVPVTHPSDGLVRFIGVLYLLCSGGINGMVCILMGGSSMTRRLNFSFTLFEYMLAGAAGIVVLYSYDDVFISEQRWIFFGLFTAFTSAIVLGFVMSCCGLFTVQMMRSPSTVELPVVTKSREIPTSRAALVAAARR